MTFARIRDAVGRPEYESDGWLFLVLTIDRYGTYSGKPFESEKQAYAQLSSMSRNFIARVRRLCRRQGWADPGSAWVSVVEAHRAGWPHMNLLLYAPELADALEQTRLVVRRRGARKILRERSLRSRMSPLERRQLHRKHRALVQAIKRESIRLHGELQLAATDTRGDGGLGWGVESTAERVRRRRAVASYLVKLAGEADSTTGELAKLSQAPLNADAHFRRLRSGKGFLPPRRKNPAYTGTLIRREHDTRKAAYGAVPLLQAKNPQIVAMQPHLCAVEEQVIEQEFLARELSRRLRIPYADVAPPRFGRFNLKGENFMVLGEGATVQAGPAGPEILTVDDEGYIQTHAAPIDVAASFAEAMGEQLTLKGVPLKCRKEAR